MQPSSHAAARGHPRGVLIGASVRPMTEGEPDPTTEKLRVQQRDREEREREKAERSAQDDETAQHERRADKAAYLREKLEERERSEREAD